MLMRSLILSAGALFVIHLQAQGTSELDEASTHCDVEPSPASLPVFAAGPSFADVERTASFVMVFDECNQNVLSSNNELLSSADIHELVEGAYTVFKLDENGSAITVERVLIGRP